MSVKEMKRIQRVRHWVLMSFLFLLITRFFFLLPACSDDHEEEASQGGEEQSCIPGIHYDYYHMEFGLDYRDGGTLAFQATCDQLEGTLTVGKGNTLVHAGGPYTGEGTLYRFPETGDSLYTMKFNGVPISQGPCGEREISLSLSLSAKKGSSYVVGGLTAYCGRDVFYGRPARIMRVSGTVEKILQGSR
jgi:hypothetical protein